MRLRVGALVVLAMAACHAKPPVPAASAPAADSIHVAGLWEQTFTRDGRQPPFVGRTRVCLGASTAADLVPAADGLRGRACDRATNRRGPDGVEFFALRCRLGVAGTSDLAGKFVPLSPTRFELVEQSVTTGAAMPKLNGRHDIRIEARWLGPCPAGVKPGETMLAGGLKVDLSRAAAAASAMFGGGR